MTIDAVITSLHGGDERTGYTHAKAIDADGIDYFIFCSAIEQTSYQTLDDCQVGSHVRGEPIEHPRGWRLVGVRIVTI